MFCTNCGAQCGEGQKFCPSCGQSLSSSGSPSGIGNTPPSPAPGQNYNYNPNTSNTADNGGFGWGLLGCCIPILGLILYLIWKDNKPKTAGAAAKGAIVGVVCGIAGCVLIFVMLGISSAALETLLLSDLDSGIYMEDYAEEGGYSDTAASQQTENAYDSGASSSQNSYSSDSSSSGSDDYYEEPEGLSPTEIYAEEIANSLIPGYCSALCDAVNSGSYYIVEPYISKGSPLESMQKSLVSNLYSKGITETFGGSDVSNIEWSSDGSSCAVYVTETETIYKSDGSSSTQTYSWKYTAVNEGGSWKLYNLE